MISISEWLNCEVQYTLSSHYKNRYGYGSNCQESHQEKNLCELDASLAYRVSFRAGSKVIDKPYPEKPKNKKKGLRAVSHQVALAEWNAYPNVFWD